MTQLSQTEIVTLAVYRRGGDQHAVDTEDAAVEAHAMAPGRFSWRKYPDQVNLELVRVYLSAAKKSRKGGHLSGSGRTGWVLTQKGLEWARRIESQATSIDLIRRREDSRAGSIDENRWRRERSRIQATTAWALWVQGERNLSVKEASEVFRIDRYSVGPLRETKITRLRSLFHDDEEVAPFLEHVAHQLNELEDSA